ncbi:MAG TPA: hypothetical protein VGB52_13445 [Actinomycetota bacterium]
MAKILVVEDAPDLGVYETKLLEEAGHHVLRCSGAPTPYTACPMLRDGSCPLVDTADLIVFSCALFAPIRSQRYRGEHLLRAYRTHPIYSLKPMLIVSVGRPEDLPGTGPIETVQKFDDPRAVIRAAERLLAAAGIRTGGDDHEDARSDDHGRRDGLAGHALQGHRRAAYPPRREWPAGHRRQRQARRHRDRG